MPTRETPHLQLSVLSFPYHFSEHTGRGHDRYVFELVNNLRASSGGANVRVVDQGLAKGALAAGMKLYKLAAELLTHEADLFHAISPVGGASAALLRKKPLVVTIHDLIPFHLSGFDSSWKYRYVRACVRICVARADAIIVPLRITRDELVSRYPDVESKIYVVNYGVDHAKYRPQPGVTRGARKVLYVGEVSRGKGVDVLIRAFAEVKSSVPDAELLIAGKTSADQQELEELSRTLGVQGIAFRGFIPEVELSANYCEAALMVFPSRFGFGLSTLEAMACGTPVVAAAALDAPEFIADAGLLAEPGDAGDLAQKIVRVLTEPGLKEHLQTKGLERAQRFSWMNMALGTRRVYDQVRAGTAHRSKVANKAR